MKKEKRTTKALLALILSAILSCMPVAAFAAGGSNTMSVHAEEAAGKDVASEETGGGTVSGNEAEKPICTCTDKCSVYEYDKSCEVCMEDHRLCAYKKPNVTIGIIQPGGWAKTTAVVTFTVTDAARTGNFEIVKIEAKIGQSGSWVDVTEDKRLEISENCTVYVLVTDQKGNTYEKNRAIKCFDTTKPTLNAAVSDGLLSIQVYDADSGAKAVYVNGYEFTDLTNGTLNIRLQQFDAGYEYFTISAMDNAGNMSDAYKTKNPYYKDPADESDENPAAQLPESAEATEPGSATGTVTEHTETDSDGNIVSETDKEQQKRQSMSEADAEEDESKDSGKGKEFYTIHTESGKVFYLIIDRDGEEETVYFLTEITENDLLNVTSNNSETLPKNSAALESAIPTSESALPNNNAAAQDREPEKGTRDKETDNDKETVKDTKAGTENTKQAETAESANEPNPLISYLVMGGLAAAVIGGGYYLKVVRKKKENFIEDEDEDEEDAGEYEDEYEGSEDDPDDDFFMDDMREADAAETLGGDDEDTLPDAE